MKMEGVNLKSSRKLMKRPALTSFKKALVSSISKIKNKRGTKGYAAKANASQAKKKRTRGTIYISHLPHGFFEDQIRDYFTQFGVVTAISLPRSNRTGRSQGHAFVEFLDKEVAEIAAQSTDKYLMSNRILEAPFTSARMDYPTFICGKMRTNPIHLCMLCYYSYRRGKVD